MITTITDVVNLIIVLTAFCAFVSVTLYLLYGESNDDDDK